MPEYNNVIGTSFPKFVKDQIEVRRGIISSETRSGEELSYLNNRTGWYRMTSAAVVEDSDELARNNILQGGVVSKNNDNTIALKKDFIERYTKGNDDDLGLRPMPGITGLSIGTKGKWQTLQEAEVQFTCYNLDQLNTLSQLYMSLGIQVFIEYGHLPYYDNSSNLINKVDTINFFDIEQSPKGIDQLFKKITKKEEDSKGNYGAIIGYVTNFNYTANPDGTYSCSSTILGPGHLAESLILNNNTGKFLGSEEAVSAPAEGFKSDFEHALFKMSTLLLDSTTNKNKKGSSIVPNQRLSYADLDSVNKDIVVGPIGLNGGEREQWWQTLSSISGMTTIDPISFSPNDYVVTDPNIKYGNATQIVNGLATPEDEGLKPLEEITHFFDGYSIRFFYPWTEFKSPAKLSYITLGHLFYLAQIFSADAYTKGNSKGIPLKIDFHPDNTVIKRGTVIATIDPFICLIPLLSDKLDFIKFFGSLNVNKEKIQNSIKKSVVAVAAAAASSMGLGAVAASAGLAFTALSNKEKNVLTNKEINIVNPLLENIDYLDDNGNIKLFNILVNLDMVLRVAKDLSVQKDDRKINLIEFLDNVLNKVSIGLGGVNNLRISVDEKNHVLRVVDENKIEKITQDKLLEIPTFGKNSVAYEYSYSSQITPNLAKQVIVAAQAIDSDGLKNFPDDVLSYNKLNGGVVDRFIGKTVPSVEDTTNDKTNDITYNGKYQKLFDHIMSIYAGKFHSETTDTAFNLTKPYRDRQQISKNVDKNLNATILMPLSPTLKIDGIAGIRPYNAFKIPDNRLPIRYRGKIAFIVYSINHMFENNKWMTELTGQTILVGENSAPEDNPVISEDELNPKVLNIPTEGAKDLINAAYPIQADGFSTSSPKAEGKASPTSGDEQENNNINPPGDGSQNNNQGVIPLDDSSTRGAPTFSSTGNDVIGATELISSNEVPGGRPLLTAYKDKDYTVKSGFTYRIGFGSDTITSPDGTVRRVQKGDTITTSMASADLNRRITQEFRPKVIQACKNNGVFYAGLPDCVKSVFIDITYNYGTLWNSIVIAYRDGSKQGLINELKRRANLGPNQVPSRRQSEINYLNTRCR